MKVQKCFFIDMVITFKVIPSGTGGMEHSNTKSEGTLKHTSQPINKSQPYFGGMAEFQDPITSSKC